MKLWLKVLVFVLGFVGVLYLDRVYWFVLPISQFSTTSIVSFEGMISLLFMISVVFVAFIISLENRNPSRTLAWLMVLGAFPVVGFFFYLLVGQSYRKKRNYAKKKLVDEQSFMLYSDKQPAQEHAYIREHQQRVLTLAQHLSNTPISNHTYTKVLTNGEETFREIIEALKRAKNHIHLEYYIVRDDHLGNEIKDILVQKALEGIEVRFLYDAVGSFQLSDEYIGALIKSGVQVEAFSPVYIPIANDKMNYRNHRKIVVVDGIVGFVGGLNIGDEYLGKDKYYGLWRDTHLKLEGEAVKSLQLIFLHDWCYETEEDIVEADYFAPPKDLPCHTGGVQIIAGGPDNEWDVLKKIFFSMITSAKQSIWIASPYFVPDEDILSAIKVAALSGIDVRILVPDRPDKRLVFYASRSYFPELLEAGVKIYEYKKGFLHSKILIVDAELASIGTANMDMRSFHLNFEINAFLYQTDSTKKLVEDFEQDVLDSNQLMNEQFKKRRFFLRLLESIARLYSPLL
ncbi:cardiolipin synthase [Priestia taiwanensis]|uniref:Cardiolipin synthase n=1 Tax=Priestia taiwanensis TaxID=1347902 RepID=A0A917ATT4_9BACI|nr:cardiolipin synthase [Priestia taiwanensis]MBM7364147.1 cardiolipin synthase [Priestia taiwanensis]GGE71998.1 cardiolipin synthase 2 [Priestia taiwanensis]